MKITKEQVRLKMQMLLSQLEEVAGQAESLGDLANQEPDLFEGTEGEDVAGALRDIYNAFMTGDKYDTEFEDQEFK